MCQPLQLPLPQNSRWASERSILLFASLKVLILSRASSAAMVPKATHEPQLPWFLIGVVQFTPLTFLQSILDGRLTEPGFEDSLFLVLLGVSRLSTGLSRPSSVIVPSSSPVGRRPSLVALSSADSRDSVVSAGSHRAPFSFTADLSASRENSS